MTKMTYMTKMLTRAENQYKRILEKINEFTNDKNNN